MNKDSKLLAEAYKQVKKIMPGQKVYIVTVIGSGSGLSNYDEETVIEGVYSTYEKASMAYEKLGPQADIEEYIIK